MHEAITGFTVGLLVGFTGIGGGALMTPLLILLFGYSPATAVGTDLLFASFTKSVGMFFHHRQKTVDWTVVRKLLTGSLPAAIASIIGISLTTSRETDWQWLLSPISFALIFTATGILAEPFVQRIGRKYRLTMPERFMSLQLPLTILAGAIIGCLVTITSIGAGAIGAVALIYLYPLRLTPPKIVGTDLAHAIPLALLAGAGHVTMGNFDYSLLIKLLAGSIPGVIFGTLACGIFSPIIVRHCIAVALMAAGFRLLSFAQ